MEPENESVLAGLGRMRAQWIANLRDQLMAHKHETHMTVSPLQLAVLFRALDTVQARESEVAEKAAKAERDRCKAIITKFTREKEILADEARGHDNIVELIYSAATGAADEILILIDNETEEYSDGA